MPPPSARKPPGGSGGSLLSDSDGHRVGARVHRTTERHGSAHRVTTFGAYGQVALAGELERIEQAPHGMRHHSVYGASARIGQLIAGGELDEAEAVKRLMAMALTIELPYSDAKRAVERGIEKGKLRPRSAPLKDPIETRTDARVEILNWWGGVLGSHWSGQRRATTFKILAGVFALAQRLGKLEFKAS